MTPSQVAANLLERDLALMQAYARKRLLPTRRLQLQMAVAAQAAHGSGAPLRAFDVDGAGQEAVVAKDDTPEEVGSVFAAVSGGNVVMLKGRKKVA